MTGSGSEKEFLSTAFNVRSNSLSFVRFFLASLVLYSHSHPLSGIGNEHIFGHPIETWGLLAVYGFFSLSGYLITLSYQRATSVWVFLWHRFLRIYPGFLVCLLVTVFFFGPVMLYFESGTIDGYFNDQGSGPYAYLRNNLMIKVHQWGISGVLVRTPHLTAINGSLWTLIYEVQCYILVAILGLCGFLDKTMRWFCLGVFIAAVTLIHVNMVVPNASAVMFPSFLDGWLLKLSLFFLAGMLFALYSDAIVIRTNLFLICLFLIYYTIAYKGFDLLGPFLITYVVFFAGSKLPFTGFDRYGDWSYGMYIYAFPIQQFLAVLGVQRYGFFVFFIFSFLLATVFAAASYHLIEAPALRAKNLRLFRRKQG